MISYFEIGGDIVELKADYDYGSGKTTAKQHRASKSKAKQARSFSRDVKRIVKDAPETVGDWESIGYVAGGVVTAAYAWATLPVVVLDGPLPILDIAWGASVAKFGRNATQLGGKIGSILDEHEFMYQ